jgi:hypothetical protein
MVGHQAPFNAIHPAFPFNAIHPTFPVSRTKKRPGKKAREAARQNLTNYVQAGPSGFQPNYMPNYLRHSTGFRHYTDPRFCWLRFLMVWHSQSYGVEGVERSTFTKSWSDSLVRRGYARWPIIKPMLGRFWERR